MQFTFGIITGGSPNVERVIQSIDNQNIPEYEIIVVGGEPIQNVVHVPFDESKKKLWITRKKNLITKHAKYDNIVYMHDYVALTDVWYQGFLEFGDDWDICMTKMVGKDWSRFRDWTLWPDDIQKVFKDRSHVLLPYHIDWMQKYMYISGAYWVAKKYVMEAEPLDERLGWGESEDVEWSFRVRDKYSYRMNEHSTVKLLKKKDRKFGLCLGKDMRMVRRMK